MTQNCPRIAVALAAYNGMDYIAEQVESILQQEGVSVTLFLNVDRSIDGTEEWVKTNAVHEPRLVMLPFGQIFGGASANFFHLIRKIDLSNFDYLAFADQDDIWLRTKLARAHQQLVAENGDGYSSNVTAFWPNGERKLVHKASPQRQWDYVFESAGPGCTYLMRQPLAIAMQKAVIAKSELLSRVVYHDWFAYAYARANGYKWIIDNYSGMLYRQHAHNQLGANTGLTSFWRRLKQVLSGEAMTQAYLIVHTAGGANSARIAELLAGGRHQMLKLAMLAPYCRRKLHHRFYFFISCLLCVVLKPSHQTRQ
jgi:rhamnosyltransferase